MKTTFRSMCSFSETMPEVPEYYIPRDQYLEHFDSQFESDKVLCVKGENAPIGLILCAGKNDEHVELMHLEESNIRVAEYMTMLPDKKILEQKLQKAIVYARERIAIQGQANQSPN